MTETQTSDLKKVQEDIYRDRILRARRQTVQERLADLFEQSAMQSGMMLGGAMSKLGTQDQAAGWAEVSRWMLRLDRLEDYDLRASQIQTAQA